MTRDAQYNKAWDGYWAAVKQDEDRPLWDADPQHAAARDLLRFQQWMDPELPLIDFGCGNGTQTRFLAQHYPQVIGVDISPVAVELASTVNNADNVMYRVFDALRAVEAETLHREIGDANIYMRGVLHQFLPEDRQACTDVLGLLLGKKGVLYLIELAPTAPAYLASLMQQYGEAPLSLRRLHEHRITPGGMGRSEILSLFDSAKFDVLSEGEDVIHTLHLLPGGANAQAPAYYMALRSKTGNQRE